MSNETCCSHNCATCSGKNCASKVTIFSALPDDQLNQVTSLITRKSYEKGDQIFSLGDVSDKLYILNSGTMKIFTYTKEGKEQILYLLNEGDFLGDLNLLKKGIFKFNGVALEKVNLCIIDKNDFDKLIHENPSIIMKVLEYAHDRISTLESLVQTITTKNADTRLAALLINLSENYGVETKFGIEISLPISREDMANYISLTRETLSRKLSAFQSEYIIEVIGTKKIIIKNMELLMNFVN
ncbi:Crp/Fnr family transcriptional regulator [Clostridium grantii]|uniref:CRP/FNR family transcriptional regulator, anaerobic regulatory protein n=1 Tax=Clostridium grantii DSM 8605 TaxID=1121316 RepID=A0A1M5TLX7_9CLOT|nr:Crp/Fnr family transcriptional regulator [Clostridium grantii]SHH51782.1 CRP/FNR family transcriptional regulator, anaerobic regulatory protein [Clostridium grantii DSM 8605]